MASRYGGSGEGVYQAHPLHMSVNKPRNINDIDLTRQPDLPGRPLDEPTDMSYFLQRIRLAEIARSIVDHNLMAVTSSERPAYYAHVMAMDFEIDQFIQTLPDFFRSANYINSRQAEGSAGIIVQAHMLNSLIHTQRCKLHLAYLTTGSRDNPAYAASRDACLKSARQIIRGELQVLQTKHAFKKVRLRLAACLYGIFIASIVLLMDVCLHRPQSVLAEIAHGDLAEALRMVKDVRGHSLAAESLHESLMQIVAKYRPQQDRSSRVAASTINQAEGHPFEVLSNSNSDGNENLSLSNDSGLFSEEFGQQDSGPDEPMYIDQVQWDDLFTGLASSSFF